MNVGHVNFAGANTNSFQELLQKPTIYPKQKPIAATVTYKEQTPKKSGKMKKVLLGSAAVAAALALGVKNKEAIKNFAPVKNLLAKESVKNFMSKGPVQAVKNTAEKIGGGICNGAAKAINFVKAFISKGEGAEEAAGGVAEKVAEAAKDAAETVAEAAKDVAETIVQG